MKTDTSNLINDKRQGGGSVNIQANQMLQIHRNRSQKMSPRVSRWLPFIDMLVNIYFRWFFIFGPFSDTVGAEIFKIFCGHQKANIFWLRNVN